MCLYSRLIKNKKYLPNKKNKGNPPICKDKRMLRVPAKCGVCIECRKQEAREWTIRLMEEIGKDECHFVTLTFSDEILQECEEGKENEFAARRIELFRKRWQKKYKKALKHWFVTELGQDNTERLHLHGIIWTKVTEEDFKKVWTDGIIDYGDYCDERTIGYIVKYVKKPDEKHKNFYGKVFASKGLGKNYIKSKNAQRNRFKEEETREFYLLPNGSKVGLPKYIREKIYTEEEREKLWAQKLNKKVRYVCGEKIDISTDAGIEEYLQCVEYHRARNAKLGYQKGKKQKKYVEYLKKINENLQN